MPGVVLPEEAVPLEGVPLEGVEGCCAEGCCAGGVAPCCAPLCCCDELCCAPCCCTGGTAAMLVEVTSAAATIMVPNCPAKLCLMATSGGYCPDYTPLRASSSAEFLGCTSRRFSFLTLVKGTSRMTLAHAIPAKRGRGAACCALLGHHVRLFGDPLLPVAGARHAVPSPTRPHPQNVAPGNHPRALMLTDPAILTTLVMCPRVSSKSARSGRRKTPANPIWLLRFTTKP